MARRLRMRPVSAIAGAMLLLVAGTAWARPPGGPPEGRDPAGFIERHAERLALSPEVRARIAGIVSASRERGDTLRRELDAGHERLRILLGAEAPDVDAVLEQADRIGALETRARKNRLRAMMEIRALLTPEQRRELVAIRAEGAGGERRGRRPPGLACRRDASQLCPEAAPGRDQLRCLVEQWDQLSAPCRRLFEAGPPGLRRWGGPG